MSTRPIPFSLLLFAFFTPLAVFPFSISPPHPLGGLNLFLNGTLFYSRIRLSGILPSKYFPQTIASRHFTVALLNSIISCRSPEPSLPFFFFEGEMWAPALPVL